MKNEETTLSRCTKTKEELKIPKHNVLYTTKFEDARDVQEEIKTNLRNYNENQ